MTGEAAGRAVSHATLRAAVASLSLTLKEQEGETPIDDAGQALALAIFEFRVAHQGDALDPVLGIFVMELREAFDRASRAARRVHP